MSLSLVLAVGWLASLSSAQTEASQARSHPVAAASTLKVEPTTFKLRTGGSIAAEQGSFDVPEQRSDPSSRRITIRFVRFKSTNANPGPPIVYLAGGPGGSGIDAAQGPRQAMFMSLRAAGDVIALDQRGTGLSNAIPSCAAAHPLDPEGGLSKASLTRYYRETLNTCLSVWRAAGVSVGGYTTNESAEDLADLAKALNAPKLRLWGISYGTHLALATMRRHPQLVDRAVLASVEGMNQTVKLPHTVDEAFGRLARATKLGLPALMRRVHERLDLSPETLVLEGPSGGVRFKMDSYALRMIAGGVAKNPSGAERLQALYSAFDQGQQQALAPMIYGMFFKDRLVMAGMPELMDLASGIDSARSRQVELQARTSLLGDAMNFPMPQLAGEAGPLDLGDTYRREVRSAVPTLVFSGDLDVRTPLEEQASATAYLNRRTTIVVQNGGHDLFEADPRIAERTLAFLLGAPVDPAPVRLDPLPAVSAR